VVVQARHLSLTSDDVLLASYPRSGSTWLGFLLYECLTRAPATFRATHEGIPGVGRHRDAPPVIGRSGRLVRTHELCRGSVDKVIYIVRDPRSVVSSLYSFSLRQGKYSGEFDDFFDVFMNGRVQPFESWDAHVRYWLGPETLQESSQVYLIKYEDLRLDPQRELDGLLRWLGEEVDGEVIGQAVNNNTVEKMRTKEDQEAVGKHFSQAKNRHFRFVDEGTIRGWRERLTPSQLALMEEGEMGLIIRRLGYPVSIRTDAE
jgi:Sulfotransferase domain